eukprot:TRINITY_DN2838_c0_g1_i2.p1 TRINITY_DN2838_c0_g1~~TRINITY_DN2838_c0_g1_i2.p1  ORF type:complete len:420 (-),score=68.73 TRINITY_DN2838_c0_g1_i2:275-1534(-)
MSATFDKTWQHPHLKAIRSMASSIGTNVSQLTDLNSTVAGLALGTEDRVRQIESSLEESQSMLIEGLSSKNRDLASRKQKDATLIAKLKAKVLELEGKLMVKDHLRERLDKLSDYNAKLQHDLVELRRRQPERLEHFKSVTVLLQKAHAEVTRLRARPPEPDLRFQAECETYKKHNLSLEHKIAALEQDLLTRQAELLQLRQQLKTTQQQRDEDVQMFALDRRKCDDEKALVMAALREMEGRVILVSKTALADKAAYEDTIMALKQQSSSLLMEVQRSRSEKLGAYTALNTERSMRETQLPRTHRSAGFDEQRPSTSGGRRVIATTSTTDKWEKLYLEAKRECRDLQMKLETMQSDNLALRTKMRMRGHLATALLPSLVDTAAAAAPPSTKSVVNLQYTGAAARGYDRLSESVRPGTAR